MKEHKELLQKWLGMLFYIQIASIAITLVNSVSNLDSITRWASKALSLVTIWSLFQLKAVNSRYRIASITNAGVFICGLLTTPINSSALSLSSILMLAGATAAWVAAYQEYHAHGELIAQADEPLAKRWNSLFILEILMGLGVSLFSTVATVVLVSAEMDSKTVTTIILAVTNIVYLLMDALYLLYMYRMLKLIESNE